MLHLITRTQRFKLMLIHANLLWINLCKGKFSSIFQSSFHHFTIICHCLCCGCGRLGRPEWMCYEKEIGIIYIAFGSRSETIPAETFIHLTVLNWCMKGKNFKNVVKLMTIIFMNCSQVLQLRPLEAHCFMACTPLSHKAKTCIYGEFG